MQSVFVFLPDVFDLLKFETSTRFSKRSANISNVPNELNLIKRAANILSQNFDFPIPHVEVEKHIPTEAGLGGGSSDCACFINSVFDFWNFSTDQKFKHTNLFDILGADTKVFLNKYFLNANLLYLDGTGISGTIKTISIPELEMRYILIVNNGSKLQTKSVFKNYQSVPLEKIPFNKINFEQILNFQNSLEKSAKQLELSLEKVLSDIKSFEAEVVGVSGSGSSCFGLFDSKEKAENAKKRLTKKYSFVRYSKILGNETKTC